jgi:hypothetical protein
VVKPVTRIDALLVLAAVLVGLVHLGYPYGREHAHVAYAGREWILHGTTPYSGTYVGDGPGLVLIAGLAAIAGGGKAVALRLVSLLSVVATGVLAPYVTVPARIRAKVPASGLAALAASVFAHGYFDYWDAARGGAFFSLALVTALALVKSSLAPSRLVLAGGFAAFALLVRPAGFPLVAGVFVMLPLGRHGLRGALALAGGTVALLGLFAMVLGPHAVADGYDLLWGGRCLFDGPPRADRGAFVFTLFDAVSAYEPQSSLALFLFALGIGLSLERRDAKRIASRALVLLVGLGTVASILLVRHYFFDYEAATAFVALVASTLADDAYVASRGRARRAVRATAVLAMASLLLFAGSGFVGAAAQTTYPARLGGAIAYLQGKLDREAFDATFDRPEIGFFSAENEQITREVRTRSTEDETILVRGFEPEIYLSADRRSSSRFIVTPPLVWNNCAYRRPEWLLADRADFVRDRPKLIVAIFATPGPDAPGYFVDLGYQKVFSTPHYVLLERP